jgi:hypothetical protein
MIPRHPRELAGGGHSLSSVRHPTHSTGAARVVFSTMLSVARSRYEMTDRQHEAGGAGESHFASLAVLEEECFARLDSH